MSGAARPCTPWSTPSLIFWISFAGTDAGFSTSTTSSSHLAFKDLEFRVWAFPPRPPRRLSRVSKQRKRNEKPGKYVQEDCLSHARGNVEALVVTDPLGR